MATAAVIASTLIVLCLYVYIGLTLHERFYATATRDQAIYTTQRMNYDGWVKQRTQNVVETRSLPIPLWNTILKVLKGTQRLPIEYSKGLKSISVILDPLDANYIRLRSPSPYQYAPEGHFVVLADPVKTFSVDCAVDFFGKRVGWVDITDYYLLKAFMNGYRIPPSSLELVHVPLTDIGKVAEMLQIGGAKGGLDYVLTYIVPQSEYHALWRQIPVALYGFQNINIDRLRLFYPFVQSKTIDLKKVFTKEDRGARLMVNLSRNNDPVLSMRMGIYVLSGKGPRLTESFISNYVRTEDAYDTSFRCYGDSRIENKAECNSPYDVIGLPKRFPTIWDRPCVKDTDCPFFQANKNYANNRGRCLKDGVCEMPVGTQRIAYQKVREGDAFQPFCYGCDNLADTKCCQKQRKPDYAFANDGPARAKNRLTTILSMH